MVFIEKNVFEEIYCSVFT